MEIARRCFYSLIHDKWGYFVLNDGYFVQQISAVNDEEAIEIFNNL